MALAKDFFSLCLVSTFFCTEAKKSFFSSNYWQLEIRLYVPTPKPRHFLLDGSRRGRVLYGLLLVLVYIFERPEPKPMRFDTNVDALNILGQEALGMISNVKLVVARYDRMRPHLDFLNATMEALTGEGRLQRLVVQFLAYQGRDRNVGCVRYMGYDMWHYLERMGLDEDGSRKEDLSPGMYEFWKEMVEVLGCMGKVGPVKEVIVCGCVTDEYSNWLENVMKEGVKGGEEKVVDKDLEGRKMERLLLSSENLYR
ncbi:hypothetical protein ONS95_000008 [Cadophora gregata]|uniref:uncharacterized protein n=1 Tax=Cadophora gregata TaxID=51156 RepID=UPI0026DDCC30|nr:uncharacterized protein ONS95_000008 [Cadophora gregata]KAK0115735.1 hypothetical protein ONS96_014171 [Cadophora gregata f. sp. sojae]KAK0128019.1 hypothetical protein ONS95_000008 [Cadophora gregata]